MMLPSNVIGNSNFGFDVPDDDPNAQRLLESEELLTGKAGQCIVFDGGRLVHRGVLSGKAGDGQTDNI